MRLGEHIIATISGRHVVLVLGGFYLVFTAVWAFALASPALTVTSKLVVSGIMGASGIILLGGGYRLSQSDIHSRYYSTIARWCLAGIGAMIGILLLYDFLPDTGISNPVRSVPILTGYSCVAGYAVGTYDARAKTHAYQLERQNALLERTQTQLEESNKRLEQFAYAASHDLQEPLRMVTSYLQLIERRYGDDLDEDGKEFIEYAIDGADRMKEMIEALLEYSRVDTRGDPFEPVDLDEVLADVRKDLELQIAETDATIDSDDLPTVEGDASQLPQLFQNLISNAIEYSGDEPPRIEISAERESGEWSISISDTGIGIDPADQDRVFEVFERLHSHDEQPGTGIGLALCKRIVERHEGEIQVDSEPGEGTTFSVTLPAATDRKRGYSATRGPPSA